MLLKDYLLNNKSEIKQHQFARLSKISPEHLWAILRGKNVPSFELAKRIERATKGQVRWHEVVEMCMELKQLRKELEGDEMDDDDMLEPEYKDQIKDL